MTIHRRFVLALCFLLRVQLAVAQVVWTDNYTASTAGAAYDNGAYAKTHNVWHLSNITLVSVSVGAGGYVCGQDSGKAVHCRNASSNTWDTEPQLGTPEAIAVIQLGQFWGLQTDNTHCSGNGYGVDYFGTSWVYASECLSQIAAATDSTIGGANLISHNAFYLPNGTGNWVQVSGTYWTAYYPINNSNGVGIKTDGSVWKNANGVITHIPSSVCTALATDIFQELYALCGGGAAYRYNGSGWDQVLGGPFTSVATGGPMNTWVVGPTQSGSNVWRFPSAAVTASATLTGSTTCNGGCPNGSVHTPSVSLTFTSHHNGGGTNVCPGVAPGTIVNCSIVDTMTDPFFCDEGGTECDSYGTASIQCSLMGLIFSAGTGGGGGGNPPLPWFCTIPIGVTLPWKSGSTVHVYFDSVGSGSGAFSGNCPGSEWCYLYQGISSWTLLNSNVMHYVSMGLDPGSCGRLPCNPAYPYMFVTVWGLSDSATQMSSDSHGQYDVMYIASNKLGIGWGSSLAIIGAHEEGHNQMLGDCDPTSILGCSATVTNTVMWSNFDASQPHFPTACDVINSNMYLAYKILPLP
jgi:hypothetical protein